MKYFIFHKKKKTIKIREIEKGFCGNSCGTYCECVEGSLFCGTYVQINNLLENQRKRRF